MALRCLNIFVSGPAGDIQGIRVKPAKPEDAAEEILLGFTVAFLVTT